MKEHAKIISYKQLFAKEIMLKTIFLKKEFYKMDEYMRISNFNEFITMKWFLDNDYLLIRKDFIKMSLNHTRLRQKFEYGKYDILLKPHFCKDIRGIIISFLIKF